MTRLGDLARGRDNHFNLVRMAAALAVIVSHAYAITGRPEPGDLQLGLNPGNLAVFVFFVTSGFLVTASLQRHPSVLRFVRARALRILPGLWWMLLLSVFGLGLFCTTLSPLEYLADRQTWRYLVFNGTLLHHLEWRLPGVFEGRAVNGSIWSLPAEVRMYLVLVLIGLVAAWLRRWGGRRGAWAELLLPLAVPCLALAAYALTFLRGTDAHHLFTLGALFFAGGVLQLLRGRVPVSGRLLLLALAGVGVAAWAGPSVFRPVLLLLLPWLVIALAHLPCRPLLRFNRLGDYSYGVYLYAFPIQHGLAVLNPGWGPWANMLATLPPTLLLAVLSWRFVESRALAYVDPRRPVAARA